MPKQPNIMIVHCHDLGQYLHCYGVPTVQTPNIDHLAGEGVRFTRMYATASMCSPSRGSLLTGQYPARNGLIGLCGKDYRWELTDPTRHLSHVLRRSGYHTALFGYQHETHDPKTLGFDDLTCADFPNPRSWGNSMPADQRASDVAAFLKSETARKRPFYLQFGTMEAHTPYDWKACPPDSEKGTWIPPYCLVDTSDPEADKLKRHIAGLQGSLHRLDCAVGIVLDALRDSGLEDNTIVLFSSDHGPELPRAKWTTYDAATRIGFLMRWPAAGLSGGRDCDVLLSNIDFVPTLADWLNLDLNHDLDGRSFAQALQADNPPADAVRDTVYGDFIYNLTYGMRTLTHSLSMNFRGWYSGRDAGTVPFLEVFDLTRDPYEQVSIADHPERADTCARLERQFWQHLKDTNDPVLKGDYGTPPYVGNEPGEYVEPCEQHRRALQRCGSRKDRSDPSDRTDRTDSER